MAIDWNRRKYTPEEFINAWHTSLSYAELSRKLNTKYSGGSFASLKVAAESLNLSDEHMTGSGWNTGDRYRQINKAKPLSEILVVNSHYSSSSLKKRLLKEKVLKEQCSAPYCPLDSTVINGLTGERVKLKLSLDHKNGNNTDNRLENLRLLCYLCHGYTETWCVGQTRGRRQTVKSAGSEPASKVKP